MNQCNICDQQFQSRNKLFDHLRSLHQLTEPLYKITVRLTYHSGYTYIDKITTVSTPMQLVARAECLFSKVELLDVIHVL